jgi:uncharacterized NAD(P)/FAD-binding protein YdhS
MKDITIIGAGLSGTLLAMKLLGRKPADPVHIRMIDRNGEGDLGPAYSTNEDHLLNVPAEIMGVYSDRPEHFLEWVNDRGMKAGSGDYLPRRLYREYIHTMFREAYANKSENISYERIKGEATDLETDDVRPVLHMEDGREFSTDKVVLAPGNSLPSDPPVKNSSFAEDKRYIRNPWKRNVFNELSPDESIFFIGTGQTTIDLATALYRKEHKGQMTGISRRGLFPLMQKKTDPYPSFYDELEGLKDIPTVLSIVRKHVRNAEEKGMDPRSVIDSLRPHTKSVWMNLHPEEKRRFLRHVFRYWERIRSRIPPASEETMKKLRESGQFKTLTGRITDIIPSVSGMQVNYRERGTGEEKTAAADRVLNCIGPCQDYDRIDNTFIRNIVRRGIIHADPAHLGINALPDGHILQKDGTPSDTIFTIGLPLKGIVWESLAAPEIRAEAELLQTILI